MGAKPIGEFVKDLNSPESKNILAAPESNYRRGYTQGYSMCMDDIKKIIEGRKTH
jgi:hypothetical protein